jgi:hypothetical protein
VHRANIETTVFCNVMPYIINLPLLWRNQLPQFTQYKRKNSRFRLSTELPPGMHGDQCHRQAPLTPCNTEVRWPPNGQNAKNFCGQTPWFLSCWVAPNQSPMLLIVTHPNYDHENIKSYKTSTNYMYTTQHTNVDALSKYIWNPRQLISCQNPSDIWKMDSDLYL